MLWNDLQTVDVGRNSLDKLFPFQTTLWILIFLIFYQINYQEMPECHFHEWKNWYLAAEELAVGDK